MPAQRIVLLAERKTRFHLSDCGRTHYSVVIAHTLNEGPGLPILHPSRPHGYRVDAPPLNRNVTSDILKEAIEVGHPVEEARGATDPIENG